MPPYTPPYMPNLRKICSEMFVLKMARAGLWSAHAWFLKIVSVWMSVCMCVCVRVHVRVHVHVCIPSPRLLIPSGMIWTPYDWLNKLYICYMATVVGILDGHGLGIDMRCGN